GGRKCEVEVSGDGAKVVDVSGLWRAPPGDGRDWRAGRWGGSTASCGAWSCLRTPTGAGWRPTSTTARGRWRSRSPRGAATRTSKPERIGTSRRSQLDWIRLTGCICR
uniref:Uncharacterized protein n=1 Tax=Aegilops tauschii subsp. strangulata TaxID=200361 RepID=A0A452ZGE4_AEGTS